MISEMRLHCEWNTSPPSFSNRISRSCKLSRLSITQQIPYPRGFMTAVQKSLHSPKNDPSLVHPNTLPKRREKRVFGTGDFFTHSRRKSFLRGKDAAFLLPRPPFVFRSEAVRKLFVCRRSYSDLLLLCQLQRIQESLLELVIADCCPIIVKGSVHG